MAVDHFLQLRDHKLFLNMGYLKLHSQHYIYHIFILCDVIHDIYYNAREEKGSTHGLPLWVVTIFTI